MLHKKTASQITVLMVAFLTAVCSTASAQSVVAPYKCVADSIIMNDKELVSVSMADYQGVAKSTEGEHSCKLSLSWFGLPVLGGMPFYLLQFDIRPAKGLEAVAQKPSNRALVAFADNGVGVYDIGNAHCTIYPEGIRMQYLITENTDCMDLFTRKDITRITLTDSLYNSIGELEFKEFCSASTIALMQESLKKASDFLPPVKNTETPLIEWPTEEAEYPNGYRAFQDFSNNNLVIPKGNHYMGTEIQIIVSFIVDEKGNLSDFKVINHVDHVLEAEALRVARLMPKWKPAKFHGKPVKTLNSVCFFFYR